MALHKVTFTAVPDTDDYETEIVCLTTPCPDAVWYECTEPDCSPTEDEEDDGEYMRHGREHRSLDVGWCLKPNPDDATCISRDDWNGTLVDDLCDIWHQVGAGTHTVDFDYWGDGCWEASLAEAKP
jgi:hypothetical protein